MKRPVLTLVACASAMASSPRAWEMNNYSDFLAGRFDGVALAKEGRLTLAPRAETLFASDQPIVWSVVRAADGTIYAATGHRGRVFRIDPQGKGTLLWTAPEPEVFALALDARGVLYAATSPNGKIYRIEDGKAAEYYAPGETYIWGLAIGKDGALYAATGDQGKIHRITGAGQGEVWYETGQTHVTSLAVDSQGRLLAGSEPNGIIYRIEAKAKGFVLYDSNLPEIRTLVPTADGSVYAVALGGSLGRRQLGGVQSAQGVPSSASVTVTATTVSVGAGESAQGGVQIKPDPAKPQTAAPVTPATSAGGMEIPGIEKSAIYRIAADNTVESLWSSKEENAYDVLVNNGELVIATDERGRIYRVDRDRRVTLLAQTNEGEATRLLASDKGVLAATGDMGKIVRLLEQAGTAGTYEAPVHDATTVARWGRLSWRGEFPAGTSVAFRTRSGNSARPDQTWSEWSEPLKDGKGSVIGSPNARYIQWRAEFTGSAGKAPAVDSVDLAYLPQNTPPVVRTVTALSQPAAAGAKPSAAGAAQQTSAYSVTVTDTGEAASATSGGTPTQAMSRTGENLQITWQAEDPDGDRMVYAVYFRGEDEREWKLLRDRLTENMWNMEAESLADGRYLFRVVASDAPANPPGSAREAELIGSPTLIDHTPPVVTAGTPKRNGARVDVQWTAVDSASPLRRAEYAVDGGQWVPVEPVDTVLDSPEERFQVAIDNLAPGEHILVFRALDAAGNAGLAKVVLR
ncbi:MAG TPA: hypothetical protein VN428_15140 [Bryobacteraceae bacterium]|nr:hypothetical protein [Bryobacteraceae bacterium]